MQVLQNNIKSKQTKKEYNPDKDADNDDDDDDYDDDFDDVDEVTEEEKKAVSVCLLLIKSSYSLVRMISKLFEEYIKDNTTDSIATLENLLLMVKELSSQVDALACCIYSAQEIGIAKKTSMELKSHCENMMRVIKESSTTPNGLFTGGPKANPGTKIMELIQKQLDDGVSQIMNS